MSLTSFDIGSRDKSRSVKIDTNKLSLQMDGWWDRKEG